MKYSIVMRTINRAPRANYLVQTVNDLRRTGLFNSSIPFSFKVYDSGSATFEHLEGLGDDIVVDIPASRVSLLNNASRALIEASEENQDFVVFLEDDILFCGSWLESIDAWLRHYGSDNMRVATFYAAYPDVLQRFQEGLPVWRYPVEAFYGSQCFALRPQDAHSLGVYLSKQERMGTDMVMKDWIKIAHRKRAVFHASCPSFVQHVGFDSSLGDRKCHQCSSFQGPSWVCKPHCYKHHL